MSRLSVSLLLAALALAGCAQINKPIAPGDDWPGRAEVSSGSLFE